MNKQELGAFLRSRRERLRPEDVGLPAGPRRRTPGLRREEVAVLAHISTEYYVRLEQGRAPRPSGEVLAGIAGALRLTDAESDHLHILAGTAPRRTGLHRRDVRPSILALLERLAQRRGRPRLVSMPLHSQLTKEESLTRFLSRTNDPGQRG